MKPPIIVFDGHDLMFFSSVHDAQLYLDPEDIIARAFDIFDSEGSVVDGEGMLEPRKVSLRLKVPNELKKDELEMKIREVFNVLEYPTDWIENSSFGDLLEEAKQRFTTR